MATNRPALVVVPNLIQGVSQQAAQSRRDAQCEEQFDCINSVLMGCAARPHADFVKLWPGRSLVGAMFSETFHDVTENYLTGVDIAGNPFAIDLEDGTDCTITNAAPNLSYLTAGASVSKDKLRAQVVDDFTFITNREKKTAMAGTTSPAKVNEALVFVRASTFGATYTVKLSGPGSVTSKVVTSQTNTAATADIAEAFRSGADAVGITVPTEFIHGTAGYSCVRSGSSLRIYRADGAAFTIETEDGNGDEYLLAFNGEAPSFTKLPARGFSGMILKVRGEKRTEQDDFYVKFTGSPATGNWVETVAPGTKTTIDPATMPHALVCTDYRTFEFRRLDYGKRIAGDTVSAKDPGFIGKYIRDLLYHQRRLCMIHQSGAVWSKTQNPYSYLPDTVQTVLATGPVDLTVSSGDKRGASVLDFGLQAQENLYLFAQHSQFRISSGTEAFKEDTVEVIPAMSYGYAPSAYPLPLGPFLFLAQEAGEWATIRVLQFAQNKLAGDVEVTSHVGQLIVAGVDLLTASDTLRYVFVQTAGNKQNLYLFNYTYDGEQGFIQTAINTWRIPGGDILWAGTKENSLRILQQRPEGVAFIRFDLTPGAVDPIPGARYSTRLDFRVNQSRVSSLAFNASTGQTSFVLPYKPAGADVLVVTSKDKPGGYTRGREFEVVSVSDYTVTVKGDLTGYEFYVGQRITARRRESEFFLRGDKGAEPTDKLDIGRFYLTLAKSGYTRAEVSAAYRETKKYEFAIRTLGGPSATTGTPEPRNGKLDVPVGLSSADAKIDLINDSFLPSYWQSAAYDYTAVGWAGVR